jgi:hypothetical protein
MQSLTVHLGSAPRFLLGPAHAPPVPPRSLCHSGPPDRRQRATVRTAMRRPRASHPGHGRSGHDRGAARRSGPGPTTPSRAAWHFHGRTPLSFLSLSSVPLTEPLKARPRPLVHSLDTYPAPPPSRVPEPPHRSPHLDRRLRPPAAHSLSQIPAEHRRRPPLPELSIPAISCNCLPPLPLRCCRTPHPPSPPTGAPSPPTNAAARLRLHLLTVDPPFRCTPALSFLPDTFPVTPSRFPTTPYHRRATAKPPPSTPLRRPARCARAAADHAGWLPRWAGLPGRGPTNVLADPAGLAANPRGL